MKHPINDFRQPAIEGWISAQPDGLLHTTKASGSSPVEKRCGVVPYQNTDEIRICLECPLSECRLDHHKKCRRLIQLIRETRKEKEK